MHDGHPTRICIKDGKLLILNALDGDSSLPLATKEQYEAAANNDDDIFNNLSPGESVHLDDGYFVLGDTLDLYQDWSIA